MKNKNSSVCSQLQDRVICLRPHHGLCIHFFEGKGYSSDFTRHMADTIKLLENGARIRLIAAEDEICGSCPNYGAGGCTSIEKVRRYDAGVLQYTGLKIGEEIRYKEFARMITEEILTKGHMPEICGDCSWSEICHKKTDSSL